MFCALMHFPHNTCGFGLGLPVIRTIPNNWKPPYNHIILILKYFKEITFLSQILNVSIHVYIPCFTVKNNTVAMQILCIHEQVYRIHKTDITFYSIKWSVKFD